MICGILVFFLIPTGVCIEEFGIGVFFDLSVWPTDELPSAKVFSIGSTSTLIPYEHYFDGNEVFNITQTVCDMAEKEIVGMVTFTTCKKAAVTAHQANLLNLPHVIVARDNEHCDFPPFISSHQALMVYPDCRLLIKAFVSITLHKAWRSVSVIYDETYGESCINYLVGQLSALSISSNIIKLSETDDADASLALLIRANETKLFTMLNGNRTEDLLRQASLVDMFSREYYWVIHYDSKFLKSSNLQTAMDGGNVLTAFFENRLPDAILSDIISAFGHGLEYMLNHNTTFSIGKYDCDDKKPTTGDPGLLQIITRNSMRENLENIKWTKDGVLDATIHISSTQAGRNGTLAEVATYNYTDGFRVKDGRLYQNLFKDFANRTLKVVSWTSTPFTMKKQSTNGQVQYHGFCYDILEEFARVFNFRYVMLDSVDGTYGGPTNDGKNGTGMVGMVMRGEADIGVGPFTVTAARETVVDFLTPFQEEGVGIIMKTKDQKNDRMFRMFLPFQSTSWIATGVSIVITGIILFVISRCSPYTNDADKPIYKNFWLAFGAFFGQLGGDSTHTSASGRIILGIWWMCTILILELYTANLAAYLTIPPAKSPIKNLEQLAASSDYKPLVKTGSNLDFLFRRAKGGLYKQIQEKMDQMPVITTTEAGYELVGTGKYAYMTDVSQLTYKVLKGCHDLLVAEETFNKAGLSFIVNANAEFKTAFNLHMIRMIEAGLIAKFHSKWWPRVSECSQDSSKSATALQIDSMAGIFIVYAAFTGLALIFFVSEMVFYFFICRQRDTKIKSSEEGKTEEMICNIAAFVQFVSVTSALLYPFHFDILANPDDADHIRNITQDFLNTDRLDALAAMNISPVTFAVHTDNKTPGINSLTVKNSTSSVYIDLKRNPSDVLCILSKSIGVAYVRLHPGTHSICQSSIQMRPSVTDYMDIAHQIYKYNDTEFTSVVYITDYIYDFDLSIFQKRFNATLKMMIFTLNNGSLPNQVKRFTTDGKTDFFIMYASSDAINNTFQFCATQTNKRTDNWVVIPSDLAECPKITNLECSVVCVRHDFANDDRNKSRSLADDFLVRSLGLFDKLARSFTSSPSTNELSPLRQLALHIYNSTKELKIESDVIKIETIKGDKVTKIGNWTKDTDVVLSTLPFTSAPASQLNVITMHEPPFVEKFTNKSGTFFRGYTIDVLDKIAQEIGFTYVIREVRDKQYGLTAPDGKWTGLVGEVQRGEADLAAAPVSVTAEREQVIDFTHPYYDYAGLQILMSGTIASSSMFGFVDVFDGPVWLAWFGFLGLTGIMLYVFHILVYRVFSKEKEKDKDKVFSISDTLWFLISSITIYGPDKTPGTFAGRVLVIGFWFFCQIMMATYTANLAAFMTSKRLTTEINSLNELASQNSIKYSSLAGSVSEAYFTRMKGIEENFFELWKNMSYEKSDGRNDLSVWDYPLDDLYSRMYSHINETGFLKSSEEGINRVLAGKFAFIQETPLIKYEMTKYCNLITVGEVFSAKPYAFVLQENSPWKEAFDAKILELQADAFFEQRKEVWWSQMVSCPKEDDSSTGLPFKNLSGVFILTGAGFATGFLMLGIECIVFKWKKRKGTNENPKHMFVRPKFPPLSTRLTSLRSLFMKPKSPSSTTSTADLTVSEMD